MIDKADIEELKEIFVTRKECQDNLAESSDKLAKYITKLSVIETELKTVLWVVTAVGGGVISIVLKLFLGG